MFYDKIFGFAGIFHFPLRASLYFRYSSAPFFIKSPSLLTSRICKGRSQGKGGIIPNPKNVGENDVIFECSIFVTNFPKIIKYSIFYWIVITNLQKNFQQFVCFVQMREKLRHGLLNYFEKYAKIMHFSNFLKKTFESSQASGGSTPGPHKRPTLKSVSPEPKSWLPPLGKGKPPKHFICL